MTKIGEGKELPKEPSIEKYHEQLDQNTFKFMQALEGYKGADAEQKARLKGVMDQSLGLIRSAVREINRPGIAKQEVLVESGYRKYMQDGDPKHLSKLEEDLTTLRDYNKL